MLITIEDIGNKLVELYDNCKMNSDRFGRMIEILERWQDRVLQMEQRIAE